MKSSEFHRFLRKNGWIHLRARGSHYLYEKKGKTYPAHITVARKLEKAFAKKS